MAVCLLGDEGEEGRYKTLENGMGMRSETSRGGGGFTAETCRVGLVMG